MPVVAGVSPTMIRMVVDLPAPFGPRKPVTRPACAVKLTSSTAVKPPYFFVSDSTLIMGQPSRAERGRRIGEVGCSLPDAPPRRLGVATPSPGHSWG